jgi:hypothetical protein
MGGDLAGGDDAARIMRTLRTAERSGGSFGIFSDLVKDFGESLADLTGSSTSSRPILPAPPEGSQWRIRERTGEAADHRWGRVFSSCLGP